MVVFSNHGIGGLTSIRTIEGELPGPYLSGSVNQPTPQEKATLLPILVTITPYRPWAPI